jgi:hypothetical protein
MWSFLNLGFEFYGKVRLLKVFIFFCDVVYPRQFEELSESGEKVGEQSKAAAYELAASQADIEDKTLGVAEERQDPKEMKNPELSNR